MGSSGAQDPRWQRWIPKTVVLARQIGVGSTSKDCDFHVPFPDSRLRVKVSLLWIRTGGAGLVAPPATLWMFEEDTEDAGFSGDNLSLTDIVGTSAAPLAIPANGALFGYTREFVSAADYISGRLTVQGASGYVGYWVLQTRYQPQSVSFGPEEWGLITAHCNPRGPTVVIP